MREVYSTHHILWQKSEWSTGYARKLRAVFSRQIPDNIHKELHKELRGLPVPSGDMLRKCWEDYQKDRDEIDAYDVFRACAWLYVHIPDPAFRSAMHWQIDFFATKKPP